MLQPDRAVVESRLESWGKAAGALRALGLEGTDQE